MRIGCAISQSANRPVESNELTDLSPAVCRISSLFKQLVMGNVTSWTKVAIAGVHRSDALRAVFPIAGLASHCSDA
jgi:hypothetical protein